MARTSLCVDIYRKSVEIACRQAIYRLIYCKYFKTTELVLMLCTLFFPKQNYEILAMIRKFKHYWEYIINCVTRLRQNKKISIEINKYAMNIKGIQWKLKITQHGCFDLYWFPVSVKLLLIIIDYIYNHICYKILNRDWFSTRLIVA